MQQTVPLKKDANEFCMVDMQLFLYPSQTSVQEMIFKCYILLYYTADIG